MNYHNYYGIIKLIKCMLEILGLQLEISKILKAPKSEIVSAYIRAAKEGKSEAEKILKNK